MWKGLECSENLNCLLENCTIYYKRDPAKRTNVLKTSFSFERQEVDDYKDKGAFKDLSATLTPLSFVQGQQRFMQYVVLGANWSIQMTVLKCGFTDFFTSCLLSKVYNKF